VSAGKVDVLAVMDTAADIFRSSTHAAKITEARAAVAELIEAARLVNEPLPGCGEEGAICDTCGDRIPAGPCSIRMAAARERMKRLDAALARIGGAP
jgi:hypothetical protein